MKRSFTLLMIALLSFATLAATPVVYNAVTYNFSGGRFGSNLLAYYHAKWISYRYGIELLYKQFPYSEQLVIHAREKKLTPALEKKYRIKDFGAETPPKIAKYVPNLYVVPYFPESAWERQNTLTAEKMPWSYFPVNWDDPNFKAELKKMVCPIIPFQKLNLPKECITVALHVRKVGDDFDQEAKVRRFPLKFPEEKFYLEQLEKLYQIFRGYPLYVYLFTEDPQPLVIKERFEKHFREKKIQFDCRTSINNEFLNVLEDFFAIMQFDCFIHGESNYALCISKIHDFMMDIYPKEGKFKYGFNVITKVNTTIRPQLFPEHLKNCYNNASLIPQNQFYFK